MCVCAGTALCTAQCVSMYIQYMFHQLGSRKCLLFFWVQHDPSMKFTPVIILLEEFLWCTAILTHAHVRYHSWEQWSETSGTYRLRVGFRSQYLGSALFTQTNAQWFGSLKTILIASCDWRQLVGVHLLTQSNDILKYT